MPTNEHSNLFELDEIGCVEGIEGKRVLFVFERNRITLHPAEELTRRGMDLGSQGHREEALALFREAAQADPYDPHAHYQEGYTLLQLQRYPQAIESYQATEQLAPGWFDCRNNLWLTEQLALGKLQRRSAAIAPAGPDLDVTEAAEALIEALDDRDQEVRFWSAEVLRRIGPAASGATPKLLPWLESADKRPAY